METGTILGTAGLAVTVGGAALGAWHRVKRNVSTLFTKVAVIENDNKNMNTSLDRIESQGIKTGEKLDRLVEHLLK